MNTTPTIAPPVVPGIHRRVPGHLARRFAQICNTMLTEVSAPHGLASWHFALLVQIRDTPGMDRNWLAAAIGCDATSTGQALERFVAAGQVLRETRADDRRAGAFTLTAAGEALFQELAGPVRTVARQIMSPLTEAESETLLSLLARLIDAHEAHARPGGGRRPPRPKPK